MWPCTTCRLHGLLLGNMTYGGRRKVKSSVTGTGTQPQLSQESPIDGLKALLSWVQTRGDWDHVLARCIMWLYTVFRLVCLGQACARRTEPSEQFRHLQTKLSEINPRPSYDTWTRRLHEQNLDWQPITMRATEAEKSMCNFFPQHKEALHVSKGLTIINEGMLSSSQC